MQKVRLRSDVLVATDIVQSGNTSAASMPIALDAPRNTGAQLHGATASLAGLGAGLATRSKP